MYYVYILEVSLKGKKTFYKGMTGNIDKRLVEHESGNVSFTKGRRPITLIHVELCNNRKEARKIEKFFKSGFGREIILEISEK